jgi:DNA-binding NarL/FixJ family response regulator
MMLTETKTMAARILIVDDHPAVREGLAMRIAAQPDLEVCGEAADIPQALELAKTTSPDVVIVDIQLNTGNGLDLIDRLKATDKGVRILVWSMYPDAIYAQRALRAGALGYINKGNTTGRIVEAIRRVRDGKIYLAEDTAENLLSQGATGRPGRVSGVEALSNRELEVFRLIGQGLASSQIAKRLSRSTHTIEAHRQSIKRKLNLKTAAELHRSAVQWMLEHG